MGLNKMVFFLDFVAFVLASDALITAWFYGSIFSMPREYLEEKGELLGELVSCPLCMSYHICFWVVLLLWLPAQLLPEPWNYIPIVPLYALAATDIVHFFQGVRPIPEEIDDEPEHNSEHQS